MEKHSAKITNQTKKKLRTINKTRGNNFSMSKISMSKIRRKKQEQ